MLQGEIGREMYIVNQGLVEVVGSLGKDDVLAELGPGSVFGEIRLALHLVAKVCRKQTWPVMRGEIEAN